MNSGNYNSNSIINNNNNNNNNNVITTNYLKDFIHSENKLGSTTNSNKNKIKGIANGITLNTNTIKNSTNTVMFEGLNKPVSTKNNNTNKNYKLLDNSSSNTPNNLNNNTGKSFGSNNQITSINSRINKLKESPFNSQRINDKIVKQNK